MTYKEKLLDPRWQKLRLKIFERDKFQCQFCGNETKTLHVHHKEYIQGNEPWDYPEINFITACFECHEILGWLKKDFNEDLFLIQDVQIMPNEWRKIIQTDQGLYFGVKVNDDYTIYILHDRILVENYFLTKFYKEGLVSKNKLNQKRKKINAKT